jgi:hypothetical protein
MALDQSALLNLLGELKLTDVTDRIRVATETLYQELIDAEVAQFRDRTLAAQDFPYVFLDATYCKARVGHRIVSQAIVVAVRRVSQRRDLAALGRVGPDRAARRVGSRRTPLLLRSLDARAGHHEQPRRGHR